MKNIRLFKTEAAFEAAYNGDEYVKPWLSATLTGDSEYRVDYSKYEDPALKEPLTFEITSPGNIVWKSENEYVERTIEYKLNDGEWTSITSATGSAAPSFSVVAGDEVKFRGNNSSYSLNAAAMGFFSGTTCGFKLKGNIMSLINSTGFSTATTLSGLYTFRTLFSSCTGLTDASGLMLPATSLTGNCYGFMFVHCTSLTTAPELPATTMAVSAYTGMFTNCTSLTTAPVLPATTLANYCYNSMFSGCTSLVSAPELPVTALTQFCYAGMFAGCTSLTTAPELPATTLSSRCYSIMFSGCTNLNYIKCLATDISASNCTNNWVQGVQTTSGTFVKNSSMSSWTTGVNGIPSNWTVQNAS